MLLLPPEGGNLAVQDLDRPPLGTIAMVVRAREPQHLPTQPEPPLRRDLAGRDSTSLRPVSM